MNLQSTTITTEGFTLAPAFSISESDFLRRSGIMTSAFSVDDDFDDDDDIDEDIDDPIDVDEIEVDEIDEIAEPATIEDLDEDIDLDADDDEDDDEDL